MHVVVLAMDEPGGKLNLIENVNAQLKVFNRPIITETLIKQKFNFTDVWSLVLRHLQREEFLQVFDLYANY